MELASEPGAEEPDGEEAEVEVGAELGALAPLPLADADDDPADPADPAPAPLPDCPEVVAEDGNADEVAVDDGAAVEVASEEVLAEDWPPAPLDPEVSEDPDGAFGTLIETCGGAPPGWGTMVIGPTLAPPTWIGPTVIGGWAGAAPLASALVGAEVVGTAELVVGALEAGVDAGALVADTGAAGAAATGVLPALVGAADDGAGRIGTTCALLVAAGASGSVEGRGSGGRGECVAWWRGRDGAAAAGPVDGPSWSLPDDSEEAEPVDPEGDPPVAEVEDGSAEVPAGAAVEAGAGMIGEDGAGDQGRRVPVTGARDVAAGGCQALVGAGSASSVESPELASATTPVPPNTASTAVAITTAFTEESRRRGTRGCVRVGAEPNPNRSSGVPPRPLPSPSRYGGIPVGSVRSSPRGRWSPNGSPVIASVRAQLRARRSPPRRGRVSAESRGDTQRWTKVPGALEFSRWVGARPRPVATHSGVWLVGLRRRTSRCFSPCRPATWPGHGLAARGGRRFRGGRS